MFVEEVLRTERFLLKLRIDRIIPMQRIIVFSVAPGPATTLMIVNAATLDIAARGKNTGLLIY